MSEEERETSNGNPDLLPREASFGVAAAKQRLQHTTPTGEAVQEIERPEEQGREFARARMAERREQWEGRFAFLRQAVPRFWKYTVGEIATYNKEKSHGMKLYAEAGLQLNTLPEEFFNQVDALARQNVRQRRQGIRQVTGGLRDLFSEMTFREKDLHRERTEIIRQLRQAVDNRTDSRLSQQQRDAAQQLLQNHPLGQQFLDVISGDAQASEALAKKLSSKFSDEALRAGIGEQKASAVELQGPVKEFFQRQVITPLLTEGLRSGRISEITLQDTRTKVQEFFFSPEFVHWYDGQPQQVKDSLQLSLSYGTDLIPMIQETLLPQLLAAKEHLLAASNLEDYVQNLVLKVNVGTLKAGTEGTINESFVERAASRTITNRRVLEVYQQIRQGQTPRLIPDTYMNAAMQRANILGNLTRLATNEVVAGMGVAIGLYAARATVNNLGRFALPLFGGSAMAGAMRALQERRLFTREYEQHEVETEQGYQFSPNARRREQMRGLERHKRQMQAELTNPMRVILYEVERGNVTPERLLELMGLIADARARFRTMDIRGIGLLAATSPQAYQVQKTNLELTMAESAINLRSYLGNNSALLAEIGRRLGITNLPPNTGVNYILDQLTNTQIDHLATGTSINQNYQAALGNLSITENQSIQTRERVFRRVRNWRTGQAFLTTTAMGIFGGMVTQEALALVGRGIFNQPIAPTIAERLLSNLGEKHPNIPAADWLENMGATKGFTSDSLKELYNQPGHIKIDRDLTLDVGPDHAASVYDSAGNRLPTPPIHINPEGKLIFSGNLDNLPGNVRKIAGVLESKPNFDIFYNVHEHLKGAVASGQHETFIHGNWILDVNSGPDHQMSMLYYPTQTQIHGFIKDDGVLSFDKSFNGNTQLASDEWNDLQNIIKQDGWKVDMTTEPGTPIFGPDGEWTKHATNIDHRQWYSYDQPGSQGNELRFHDFKEGSRVILDMNNMQLGFQKGLNPNPIDVQQVIKNHEAGWYFSLPNSPQDGIWVPDGADGVWDGKLVLDPNDSNPTHIIQTSNGPMYLRDLAKLVLNQEALQKYPDGNLATEVHSRQDVFNLGQDGKYGFIEAGRVVQRDGTNVLQDFATIRGIGEMQAQPPREILTLEPPGATEITPPSEVEVPPIPIPIPRRPLEAPSGTTPEPPLPPPPKPEPENPYYGYGGQDETRRRESREASARLESFLRNDPHLLNSEKDEAVSKAKEFINRPEPQQLGPLPAADAFRQVWSFVLSYPDITILTADDGTVTETIKQQLLPIVSTITTDAPERDELVQAIGKFVLRNPAFLTGPDSSIKIQVLCQAYRTTRSIISPI